MVSLGYVMVATKIHENLSLICISYLNTDPIETDIFDFKHIHEFIQKLGKLMKHYAYLQKKYTFYQRITWGRHPVMIFFSHECWDTIVSENFNETYK